MNISNFTYVKPKMRQTLVYGGNANDDGNDEKSEVNLIFNSPPKELQDPENNRARGIIYEVVDKEVTIGDEGASDTSTAKSGKSIKKGAPWKLFSRTLKTVDSFKVRYNATEMVPIGFQDGSFFLHFNESTVVQQFTPSTAGGSRRSTFEGVRFTDQIVGTVIWQYSLLNRAMTTVFSDFETPSRLEHMFTIDKMNLKSGEVDSPSSSFLSPLTLANLKAPTDEPSESPSSSSSAKTLLWLINKHQLYSIFFRVLPSFGGKKTDGETTDEQPNEENNEKTPESEVAGSRNDELSAELTKAEASKAETFSIDSFQPTMHKSAGSFFSNDWFLSSYYPDLVCELSLRTNLTMRAMQNYYIHKPPRPFLLNYVHLLPDTTFFGRPNGGQYSVELKVPAHLKDNFSSIFKLFDDPQRVMAIYNKNDGNNPKPSTSKDNTDRGGEKPQKLPSVLQLTRLEKTTGRWEPLDAHYPLPEATNTWAYWMEFIEKEITEKDDEEEGDDYEQKKANELKDGKPAIHIYANPHYLRSIELDYSTASTKWVPISESYGLTEGSSSFVPSPSFESSASLPYHLSDLSVVEVSIPAAGKFRFSTNKRPFTFEVQLLYRVDLLKTSMFEDAENTMDTLGSKWAVIRVQSVKQSSSSEAKDTSEAVAPKYRYYYLSKLPPTAEVPLCPTTPMQLSPQILLNFYWKGRFYLMYKGHEVENISSQQSTIQYYHLAEVEVPLAENDDDDDNQQKIITKKTPELPLRVLFSLSSLKKTEFDWPVLFAHIRSTVYCLFYRINQVVHQTAKKCRIDQYFYMLSVDVAECRKGMPEAVVPVRLVACEGDGSKEDELWLFGFPYKDNNKVETQILPLNTSTKKLLKKQYKPAIPDQPILFQFLKETAGKICQFLGISRALLDLTSTQQAAAAD
ncbi:hypothetical protein TYRP_015932 [Tyrophagus putrescentiae]|nr:hypothetical protein TYRP_015932 [Tyrophagus putrescentiae]